jgi:hypothetical protein
MFLVSPWLAHAATLPGHGQLHLDLAVARRYFESLRPSTLYSA